MNENGGKSQEEQQPVVGIIGLGYVGMPLLLAFREAGCSVIGVDIDPDKVNMLKEGKSYLSHIPSERISSVLSEKVNLTTEMSEMVAADAVIITVPTPLTDVMTPDLSYVENTADALGQHLRKDQLVSLESTTYPGTTREVLIPRLEESSKLKAGKDFYVAFSPERVDPGDESHDITEIPKLVSGLDAESLRLAMRLYSIITPQVVEVSDLEIAEMAKLLENVYRAVNIALVNELKMLADAMGIDIWEVIEAASTKPFGFQTFYPGPGLGGHCLPIDPFYLHWRGITRYGFETRFVELAGRINTAVPPFVVNKTRAALEERGIPLKGASILVMGVSYKEDISDVRESPGLKLMSLFEKVEGAEVSYHDPFVPVLHQTRDYPYLTGRPSSTLNSDFIAEQDAVVIATCHSDVDYEMIAENASLVVDTRNAMKNLAGRGAQIVKA